MKCTRWQTYKVLLMSINIAGFEKKYVEAIETHIELKTFFHSAKMFVKFSCILHESEYNE